MKIILIDPYGDAYGTGYASALSEKVDLHYFTANHLTNKSAIKGSVYYTFLSGGKNNFFTKIKKVISLISSYKRVLKLLKHNKIDLIHIQWLQFLPVDYFFISKINKYSVPIVYTSHNAVPHISGAKKRAKLIKIFPLFSKIIVHGKAIKEEFLLFFPEFENKIVIQKHGTYEGLTNTINPSIIPKEELAILNTSKKVCIFFGAIFYNKGLDRLLNIWNKSNSNINNTLIVLGRIKEQYPDLENSITNTKKYSNIIIHNGFIEEELLNAYLSLSDIVLMPYRHASMSGVIFKAALFKKTVLTTNVGAIPEYLDEKCAFVCKNTDICLEQELSNAMATKREELERMGNRLFEKINKECNWNNITNNIISTIYKPLIEGTNYEKK